ncbi:alpha/beta hydrolase [uncultured Enterovirga sp.]|uniref:alpha/beta hydrolase n=1 Tax=uncultured Enterovirga sp. TaxID=2026352 RepID=UPI0035C9B59F
MSTATALSYVHRFEPASLAGQPALLLLHGTGGDEHDLLALGRAVAPGAALISPRGQVLENGMPRFFRRLTEGVFDEADVRRRAHDLADFVLQVREAYGLSAPIAVGFSNGANIAAAILLLRPDVLAGAALLRAMVPLADPPKADLIGKPVLILSGAGDPIVPADNARRLATLFKASGANVEHQVMAGGHGLSQEDVSRAATWLRKSLVKR